MPVLASRNGKRRFPGRIGIGAHRHRRLAGGVGEASGVESAKIVCNQRERPRSEPAASEGSHGGMERPAGAIYRPGRPKRSLFTAERSVAVNKDARSRQCFGMQATDRLSGQTTMRATFRVGTIIQPLTFCLRRFMMGVPLGECQCVHQSSFRVGRTKMNANYLTENL